MKSCLSYSLSVYLGGDNVWTGGEDRKATCGPHKGEETSEMLKGPNRWSGRAVAQRPDMGDEAAAVGNKGSIHGGELSSTKIPSSRVPLESPSRQTLSIPLLR